MICLGIHLRLLGALALLELEVWYCFQLLGLLVSSMKMRSALSHTLPSAEVWSIASNAGCRSAVSSLWGSPALAGLG